MPFVMRDDSKAIVGVFAVIQPGMAEEELPDDHPDMVAFRDGPQTKPRDPLAEIDALKAALIGKSVIVQADIAAAAVAMDAKP